MLRPFYIFIACGSFVVRSTPVRKGHLKRNQSKTAGSLSEAGFSLKFHLSCWNLLLAGKVSISFRRSIVWRSRSKTAPPLPKFAAVLGGGKGRIPQIRQYDVKLKKAPWIRNVVVRSLFLTRLIFFEAVSIDMMGPWKYFLRSLNHRQATSRRASIARAHHSWGRKSSDHGAVWVRHLLLWNMSF